MYEQIYYQADAAAAEINRGKNHVFVSMDIVDDVCEIVKNNNNIIMKGGIILDDGNKVYARCLYV